MEAEMFDLEHEPQPASAFVKEATARIASPFASKSVGSRPLPPPAQPRS